MAMPAVSKSNQSGISPSKTGVVAGSAERETSMAVTHGIIRNSASKLLVYRPGASSALSPGGIVPRRREPMKRAIRPWAEEWYTDAFNAKRSNRRGAAPAVK